MRLGRSTAGLLMFCVSCGIAPATWGKGKYELTAEEKGLDCAKLTGRMKVKIAILRSDLQGAPTSAASRAIQGAVTPIFGGPGRGKDPAGDIARERAKLAAFNARLAETKCKTLDIDAELKGVPSSPPAKAR